jgi:hypothetical protein
MQVCRLDLTTRALSMAVGLCALSCMTGAGAAEAGNTVISNVPLSAGLPGEGIEPPYLHGVQTKGETHTRAHDIRAPTPFGRRNDGLGTEPREAGSSRLQEFPAIDPFAGHDSAVRRDAPIPTY